MAAVAMATGPAGAMAAGRGGGGAALIARG